MTFEDETAKSASNALRELLNGAICGGHCGDEGECSHYDATDRALSALSEAGYTVVKTEWESAGMFTGMRRVVGPWVPVPESDTLGGGEQ